METLNYIGSKKTLFKTLKHICDENINEKDILEYSFVDLFAGTGTIGFNMNNYFSKIIANDLEYYSYVINYALLKSNWSKKLEDIIKECNNLSGVKGLIYNNFSPNSKCERMFFTNENAEKCDAIRQHINTLLEKGSIIFDEYMFLLGSLLISIDKMANTSSVYGAYLKKYKKSALKPLIFKPIHTIVQKHKNNIVYNNDIIELVKDNKFNKNLGSSDYVIYLDPPYNQRQYSSNYSPLNYIALYDNNIELLGKTGLIKNYNKSDFCSKVKVKSTFINLIKNLKAKYIILSYNNEGLVSFNDLKEILLDIGDVILYKIEYNKFKAQKNVEKSKVIEYIWFVNRKESKTKKYTEQNIELIK
jgi:adenine-specific DNA-methyltransferase